MLSNLFLIGFGIQIISTTIFYKKDVDFSCFIVSIFILL